MQIKNYQVKIISLALINLFDFMIKLLESKAFMKNPLNKKKEIEVIVD